MQRSEKEEQLNLARHYLNIASTDLKVSELLYKNGYYPAAVFHLEQASEKLIKSFGYKFRPADSNNRTAHATWAIYSSALEDSILLDRRTKRAIILESPVLEYLFKKFKLGRRKFKNSNAFLSEKKNYSKIKKIDFPDDVIIILPKNWTRL